MIIVVAGLAESADAPDSNPGDREVVRVQVSHPAPSMILDCFSCARLAELVDAPASGAGIRKGVGVRIPHRAPNGYAVVAELVDAQR